MSAFIWKLTKIVQDRNELLFMGEFLFLPFSLLVCGVGCVCGRLVVLFFFFSRLRSGMHICRLSNHELLGLVSKIVSLLFPFLCSVALHILCLLLQSFPHLMYKENCDVYFHVI